MAEKLTEMDYDGRPKWWVEGARLRRFNLWDIMLDARVVPLLPVGCYIGDSCEKNCDRTYSVVYTTSTPVNVREVDVLAGDGGGGGGGGGGGDEVPGAMEQTHGSAQWATVAECGAEAAESMTGEERAKSCHLFSRWGGAGRHYRNPS